MNEYIEFNEEYNREKPVSSYDMGIINVNLEDIVGTVGRYRDFDRDFAQLGSVFKERFSQIKDAIIRKIELPPLELYKLKDKYFILDGHHRVIMARNMGEKVLKARVVEFLPPKNSVENLIAREKSEFELITGLKGINLTELSQYEKLQNQIREHNHYLTEKNGVEINYKDCAIDWYENIYKPIVERIEEEGLLKDFPDRTSGDLYVYISDHKWMESQRRGYDIGFSAAIEEFHKKNCGRSLKEIIKSFFSSFRIKSPRCKVFEERTGLRDINLSKDISYSVLLKQIREHKYYLSQKKGIEVSLEDAAFHWRYEIFEPVKRILEEERYSSGFHKKTSADLYLMLSELKWFESEKKGYDIGFMDALEEFKKQKKQDSGRFRHKIRKLLKGLKENIL